MNNQVSMILAVWRHSRIGWVGVAIITCLIGIPLGFEVLRGHIAVREVEAGNLALLQAAKAVGLIAIAPAALMGIAWKALIRQGVSLLHPGFQSTSRRAGLLQMSLIFLALGTPAMVLAAFGAHSSGHSAEAWAWILAAAGLTAASLAIGLATTAQSLAPWQHVALAALVVALSLLPSSSALLALAGSVRVLALCTLGVFGAAALGWSLSSIYGHLVLRGSTVHRRDVEVESGAATTSKTCSERSERSAAWKQLWLPLPAGQRGLGSWTGFGFAALAWLIFVKMVMDMPWPVAAVMLLMVGASSMPWAGSAWASPRLALLPLGLHRNTAWRQLSLRLAQRAALRLLVVTIVVVMAAMTWQAPVQELLALGIACVASSLLNASFVMAFAPSLRSAMAQALLGLSGSMLVLMGMVLTVLDVWPLPNADSWALPLRAATIALWSVLLCAGLAQRGRRAWARMDWAQQPAAPPLAQWIFGQGKTGTTR